MVYAMSFTADCLDVGLPAHRAQILVFNVDTPIINGTQIMFHHQQSIQPGVISKLIALLDKSTVQPTKQKPRHIASNSLALVELRLDEAVCLELHTVCKELGRFALRSGDHTIAAGLVTELI
jgi:elongation factor 1 alpha-like protein